MLDPDPVRGADALCDRPGRAEFLSVDLEFVRALEDTLETLPATELARRARVAARLALELRSDSTTLDRRRALLEAARADAAEAADPAATVETELAGVHALWEPAAATERLDAADRAVAVARASRLVGCELDARMARVDALLGLGRLLEADVELGTYGLLAPRDDPERHIFAASRRSTLALLRGRFDEAGRAADEVAAVAVGIDRGDVDQVLLTLRGMLARERGDLRWLEPTIDGVAALVARLPGQHFEAILARLLLEVGRRQESRIELARAVASLRAGHGPMWLALLYEAAAVAAEVGRTEDREWLLAALESCEADFATFTLWFAGSTHSARGGLAFALDRPEAALLSLDRAVADLDAIGALPLAARARRLRAEVLRVLGRVPEADADERDAALTFRALGMGDRLTASPLRAQWSLVREPEVWHLIAGTEDVRLSHSRGLDHLRTLLANPRHEIPAVVLEAGGHLVPESGALEAVDDAARGAYRGRLVRIEEELRAAERRGDAPAAAALESERSALVAELKRALGLGGRVRRDPDASERARVNVTRSIRRAIDRISLVAPQAGLHLAASVRTGSACRYEPAAGGPAEWKLN